MWVARPRQIWGGMRLLRTALLTCRGHLVYTCRTFAQHRTYILSLYKLYGSGMLTLCSTYVSAMHEGCWQDAQRTSGLGLCQFCGISNSQARCMHMPGIPCACLIHATPIQFCMRQPCSKYDSKMLPPCLQGERS